MGRRARVGTCIFRNEGRKLEDALRLAQSDGAVAGDIIEWHRLRAGQGTAQERLSFWKRMGIGLDCPGGNPKSR